MPHNSNNSLVRHTESITDLGDLWIPKILHIEIKLKKLKKGASM